MSGILASLILAGFESQMAAVTALALFIPIIGGTGGNVGVQASAIVVQGLANGSLEVKEFGRQLGKEVLIGLLNAVVPLTLEKLHINPALATGPFIQISNDIVGLVIYVFISKWCLQVFGA